MSRASSWWLRWKHRHFRPDETGSERVRFDMAVAAVVILGGFVWMAAQAAVYQVMDHDDLERIGVARIHGTMNLEGERGRILDRTGRGILAANVPTRSVAFLGAPPYIDRTEMAFSLATALDEDPERLLVQLMTARKYALLKRNLTDVQVATLERLQIPGIHLFDEPARLYPLGPILGPVLGTVLDGVGNRGLEARYDSVLRERQLGVSVLRDARRQGVVDSPVPTLESLSGADLIVSLHPEIQFVLEAELERKILEENAMGAMGVVLDPRTFEVLAMASLPAMDPNDAARICAPYEQKQDSDSPRADDGTNPCRNKVVSYVYEPGSVAKILTLAAGIEAGKLRLDTPVNGHLGTCRVGRFEVRDVKKVGVVPVRDAIKYSSNCAMSEAGLRVGAEALRAGLAALGIGRRTGVDLPGEATGVLRPADRWGLTNLMTASYGYSYSTTLMQIATAVATIATGGLRRTPHLAIELRAADGRTLQKFGDEPFERVLKEETAQAVRSAMTAVVMEEGGTGVRARPDGYSAAGKTGTARMTGGPARGDASRRRYVMTFAGFAPVEDPRVVVVVSVIDPREHPYAGQVVAPVFRAVVERALPILGVRPEPRSPADSAAPAAPAMVGVR